MKQLFFLALTAVVVSCSTTNNSREIASIRKDLTGTYLGVAEYKSGHKGPDKPAVRIYFHPIEGKKDTYSAVLLEYVDLLKMAPSYVASNKLPWIAKRTGFLKNITSNVSAYEVVPGPTAEQFLMYPVAVNGKEIIANKNVEPRTLTLSTERGLSNPIEGATISPTKPSEPEEIFFPKKDDKRSTGIQYGTAKLAYEKAKLESTWRKEFLRGPYLSQYYKVDDVVLKLSNAGGNDISDFIINPNIKKSDKKRREMFTNEKSAFLKGKFQVSEPRDGMFLFNKISTDFHTLEVVEGRIGLFIDIFDATKSLNQDVVELVLINTEEPEDFLMYYEHPKNGEGRDKH